MGVASGVASPQTSFQPRAQNSEQQMSPTHAPDPRAVIYQFSHCDLRRHNCDLGIECDGHATAHVQVLHLSQESIVLRLSRLVFAMFSRDFSSWSNEVRRPCFGRDWRLSGWRTSRRAIVVDGSTCERSCDTASSLRKSDGPEPSFGTRDRQVGVRAD